MLCTPPRSPARTRRAFTALRTWRTLSPPNSSTASSKRPSRSSNTPPPFRSPPRRARYVGANRGGRVNREQRRHPETPEGADRRDPPSRAEPPAASERPQEVGSVRAKNTGHKKKTADKWNQ